MPFNLFSKNSSGGAASGVDGQTNVSISGSNTPLSALQFNYQPGAGDTFSYRDKDGVFASRPSWLTVSGGSVSLAAGIYAVRCAITGNAIGASTAFETVWINLTGFDDNLVSIIQGGNLHVSLSALLRISSDNVTTPIAFSLSSISGTPAVTLDTDGVLVVNASLYRLGAL